jgi:hypothetical protein
LDLNERANLLAREVYPEYMDTRAKAGVPPIDSVRRQTLWEVTGQEYTHEAILLPTVTAMDSMEMLLALMTGIGLTVGSLPGIEGPELVGDWEARFFEPLLGATHPVIDSLARGILSTAEMDLDYQLKGPLKNLNEAEADAVRLTPILRHHIRQDPETGRYQLPTAQYMLFRLIPIASTQVSRWSGAARNPDWERGWEAGSLYALRRITGILDPRPFNVNRELESRMRAIDNQYNKWVRKMGDVRKAEEFDRRGLRYPWSDDE